MNLNQQKINRRGDRNSVKILILVGGFGTRLRPLTDTLPKPMIPLLGQPLLLHIIEWCRLQGFKRFVLATHYLPEKIRDFFADGKKFQVEIEYAHEPTPLGGAGALKLAEHLLTDTFIVLNGDTFSTMNLSKLILFHHQKKSSITTVAHITSHPQDSDIIKFNPEKKIVTFGRLKEIDISQQYYGNAGIFVFSKDVLKFIKKNCYCSIEKDLIPLLIQNHHHPYVYEESDLIYDIGTIERLHLITNMLKLAQL